MLAINAAVRVPVLLVTPSLRDRQRHSSAGRSGWMMDGWHGRAPPRAVSTRIDWLLVEGSHSSSSFFATVCFRMIEANPSGKIQHGLAGWSSAWFSSAQRAATASHSEAYAAKLKKS